MTSRIRRGGFAIALPTADAQFPPSDVALAQQLTDAVSIALANLRALAEVHRIALTLQRALLPERLPGAGLVPRCALHGGERGVSVGGDFYDAFLLPSGETALVIGDVQGHSLRAATVMAELRFSLRAYLLEGHRPTEALALLNMLLLRSHPEETAIVLLLVVAADGSRAVLANAGHLPPLLVTPTAVTLVEEHGPLLGVPGVTPPSVEIALPKDALVLLTTDRLIERRGVSLDDQLAEMARVVQGGRNLDEEQVADALLDCFAGRPEDDIALLVLRHR